MMILRMLARLVPYALKLVAAVAAVLLFSWASGNWLIDRAESGAQPPPPGTVVHVGPNSVHYVESGTGPALVLLHGVPGSALDWPSDLVSALATRHRVVALDLLGFGWSSRRPGVTLGRWAAQVVGTMEALDLTGATVVGHDVGGAVAVAAAARAPERIARLVLLAPTVPLDRDDWTGRLRLLITPGLGEGMAGWSSDLLRPVGTPVGVGEGDWWSIPGTRRGALEARRDGIDPVAFAAALREVRAPTLVLHGKRDTVVPWGAAERWVPSIAGVMVQPLPDVGHWPAQTVPALVASAIVRFTTDDGQE